MSNYIVYTGNAYPHKNLTRLILAVKSVGINLKIISGRSIFIERLKKEIKRQNVEKLVNVLEFVPDEKLKEIYKNSVGFVFPTLAEGFGLPPMEAINAETIAIVSDIPVLREVYKGSVYYFDPLDIDSISNAIKKVLNLTKLQRDKKIKSAKEFVKRYSWHKMAKETLKIYESVI